MAASINLGSFFVGVLRMRLGVYYSRALVFGNSYSLICLQRPG